MTPRIATITNSTPMDNEIKHKSDAPNPQNNNSRELSDHLAQCSGLKMPYFRVFPCFYGRVWGLLLSGYGQLISTCVGDHRMRY